MNGQGWMLATRNIRVGLAFPPPKSATSPCPAVKIANTVFVRIDALATCHGARICSQASAAMLAVCVITAPKRQRTPRERGKLERQEKNGWAVTIAQWHATPTLVYVRVCVGGFQLPSNDEYNLYIEKGLKNAIHHVFLLKYKKVFFLYVKFPTLQRQLFLRIQKVNIFTIVNWWRSFLMVVMVWKEECEDSGAERIQDTVLSSFARVQVRWWEGQEWRKNLEEEAVDGRLTAPVVVIIMTPTGCVRRKRMQTMPTRGGDTEANEEENKREKKRKIMKKTNLSVASTTGFPSAFIIITISSLSCTKAAVVWPAIAECCCCCDLYVRKLTMRMRPKEQDGAGCRLSGLLFLEVGLSFPETRAHLWQKQVSSAAAFQFLAIVRPLHSYVRSSIEKINFHTKTDRIFAFLLQPRFPPFSLSLLFFSPSLSLFGSSPLFHSKFFFICPSRLFKWPRSCLLPVGTVIVVFFRSIRMMEIIWTPFSSPCSVCDHHCAHVIVLDNSWLFFSPQSVGRRDLFRLWRVFVWDRVDKRVRALLCHFAAIFPHCTHSVLRTAYLRLQCIEKSPVSHS